MHFIIRNIQSGRYLSSKGEFFGDLRGARLFADKESAAELRDSCVDAEHRGQFEIVAIDAWSHEHGFESLQ